MMFHVEQNSKNLYCETKDYLVTGERFKIYLDKNNIVGKTFPVPKKKEMSKYYDSEENRPHSLNKKTFFGLLYDVSRKYMHMKKLMWMKSYLKPTSKVLDYGCGSGEFVKHLRGNSINAYGYDPNINFHVGGFPDYLTASEAWKNKKYDIIFLWHVLEHIHNPFELIEILKKNLNKDGLIFIAIPNFKSYDSRHYGKYWAGLDAPRHLWHFSRKSIYRIAEKNEFKIINKKNLHLDSIYVSCMSEKNRSRDNSFFLGILVGCLSIIMSFFTNESSSFLFVFKKL